jgi:hypothetical protein
VGIAALGRPIERSSIRYQREAGELPASRFLCFVTRSEAKDMLARPMLHTLFASLKMTKGK